MLRRVLGFWRREPRKRSNPPIKAAPASSPAEEPAGEASPAIVFRRIAPRPSPPSAAAASGHPGPLRPSTPSAATAAAPSAATAAAVAVDRGGRHRPLRPLDQPLEQLGILDAATCRRLNRMGVFDGRGFVALDTQALLPGLRPARIKRLQHAVRMAHTIGDMHPWQALILFAIHRRSPNKLALESPGAIYRDITRLAWSSVGQRLLKGRTCPGLEEVEAWVASARRRRRRRRAA